MHCFLISVKVLFLLGVMVMAAPANQGEDVDPQDPEVQACAKFAVESFNFFYQDPHLYLISKFTHVRRLNVGGGQYDIDLILRKTQSLKEKLHDPRPGVATNTPGPKVLKCHFSVLSSPWRNQRILLRSSCS